MRLLSCRNIAGIDYITDNVSYFCDTINPDSYYNKYSGRVVAPIILAFIIFIPFIMYIGLRYYAR